nr:MAG TPA: hypothetical protein [Caudoviricetes sp.]
MTVANGSIPTYPSDVKGSTKNGAPLSYPASWSVLLFGSRGPQALASSQ